MALVGDIMTRQCYSLIRSQSLAEAVAEFDRRCISGAPVVDEEGVVVGLLSRSGVSSFLARSSQTVAELTVAHVMQDFAFQAYADDSVESLLETMLASRIHRMIVTDEEGRPVGIVTSMDLMGHLYDLLKSNGTAKL